MEVSKMNLAELSVGDLVEFAIWLIDTDYLPRDDSEALLYYFEKPFKYETEYAEYLEYKEESLNG